MDRLPGYAPVAVDLFNVILDKLHDELRRLGVKGPAKPEKVESANAFRERFLELYRLWAKHTAASRVILMFDELDKYFPERRDSANEATLREYVALFRMLRALAQEERYLSILAVAYRPGLNRQNLLTEAVGENPMFMSFQEYFLTFLAEEDTRTMIRELGRWRSIEWEDAALGLVFELSGGHPLLARFIASDACEQGAKRHVGEADVQALGAEIRRAFHRHRLGKYLEESVWNLLRADEKEILRRAAVGNPGLRVERIEPELNDALANLLHFGLLVEQGDESRVHGALLQDWVRTNEAHQV